MDDHNNRSRLRKLEKRRKNTKLMSILIIVAGVLLLLLVFFWIFGGKDKDSNENKPGTDSSHIEDDDGDSPDSEVSDDETDEKPQLGMDEDESDEPEDESEEEHHVVETTEVEPSDDNVIEAYTGDWRTIETVQEGPHTTNYDDGSQDRIEIKEGVMRATGLSEDLVEWRVGNGGDQKVIATVSDPGETRLYRVYLSWIEDQGWQPEKVEVLKENDKK